MNPFKVFAGITLIFVGLTLLSISSMSNVQFGGVVMIGPIPIVFGTSPSIAAFALVIAVVFLLFAFFAFRF